jgi:hypothetical protein
MVRHHAIVAAVGLLCVVTTGCGSSADLKLLSLECGRPFGLFQKSAKGEVQNISSHSLRGIIAVVTFRADDSSLTETRTARIQDYLLRSGATSWFEAITMSNASFSTCEVAFTDESRRTVPHAGGWFGAPRKWE